MAEPRYTNVHADLVGVTDSWYLETFSNSIVNVTNNTYAEYLSAEEQSDVTMLSGTVNSGTTVADHAKLTFGGTARTNDIGIGANAAVQVTGGLITNHVGTEGNGQLDITGGSVGYSVVAGGLGNVQFGGSATTVNFFGQENATATIAGGSITGFLETLGASHVTVTGGDIAEVRLLGTSTVDISGGHIGPHTLYGLSASATVNLFGTGFVFANPTAGTFNGSSGYYWDVTGTLLNGDTLSTRYFDTSGNTNAPQGLQINPATVPENGTLTLLAAALSCVGLVAYRRTKISA